MVNIKKLDYDLFKYLNELRKNNITELKKAIKKILNKEYIRDLDMYSREILYLSLEKRMMITLNDYNISSSDLENNIDLYIENFYNYRNNNLSIEKEEYNKKIKQASLKFTNQVIKFPGGKNISIEDILKGINDTLNFETKENNYSIENVKYRLKKVTLISSMITMLGTYAFSIYAKHKPEPQVVSINTNDYNEGLMDNILNNLNVSAKAVFVGYDCNCPRETQEYIYYNSIIHDIPFNAMMSIAHVESGGYFNNKGVVSETNDYGFFQINIINHKEIYEKLGYTSDDLRDVDYMNIDAAAYLLEKMCNMYKDEIEKGDYENLFGTYNGWINWKQYEISRDYSQKCSKVYKEIYNKEEIELYKWEIDYEGRTNSRVK